jgi:hypothetical protein
MYCFALAYRVPVRVYYLSQGDDGTPDFSNQDLLVRDDCRKFLDEVRPCSVRPLRFNVLLK